MRRLMFCTAFIVLKKRNQDLGIKMTDFVHLTTSKVNIGLVQELACNELLEILDKCEGTKVHINKFD